MTTTLRQKQCIKQWAEIVSLQAKENHSQEESDKLDSLKHNYMAVLGADYQMQ